MSTGATAGPQAATAASLPPARAAGGPAAATRLSSDGLRVRLGRRDVLHGISLEFEAGTTTAVVGPNGCGKSTLLRALARLLAPTAGAVYLDGHAIGALATREVARRLAVLPQAPIVPEGVTVEELVEQGRYAHTGPLRMLGRADRGAVDAALRVTGVEALRRRQVDHLSGGERQRVWIALVLAQEPEVLLLDEPTTFLDLRHQIEVLELVRRLNREKGITIVVALHDVNHAARYADRLVALKDGVVAADGPAAELLTPALVEEVFEVQACIVRDPRTGLPVCIPYLEDGPEP